MYYVRILHTYLHTHTGDYQHSAVQLREAQMKLQEQSRSHEEELVRVRGMPSDSSSCALQCMYMYVCIYIYWLDEYIHEQFLSPWYKLTTLMFLGIKRCRQGQPIDLMTMHIW